MGAWHTMSWTEKFTAIYDVFGSATSDCAEEELAHLWQQIQARGLTDAYIAALAAQLGLSPPYTPANILTMMLASDSDQHWPAALRAAGRWSYD